MSDLAKTKTGAEAEALYQQALSKYQRATELKPDKIEAFDNWGYALIILAQTKTGTEKLQLLREAKNRTEKAYHLGGNSYNLACANALLNNIYDALQYLEEALNKGNVTIEHVMNDSDWANFRDKQSFSDLVDKYRK